jgi:hypothetical protein
MYIKLGGVAAYHIVWIDFCLMSVPGGMIIQAKIDPNNMICCHAHHQA